MLNGGIEVRHSLFNILCKTCTLNGDTVRRSLPGRFYCHPELSGAATRSGVAQLYLHHGLHMGPS